MNKTVSQRCRVSRRLLLLVALLGTSCTGCGGEKPHSVADPMGPVIIGWTENQIDNYTCIHPPVIADCADGWCRIPAGCFIMGSPETEYGRGMYDELPTAVELTHSFEIGGVRSSLPTRADQGRRSRTAFETIVPSVM
jgi:hypothetical protein